ncbi:TetR/AcrR family transcriptional regulator [Neobacillus citreus]|uniref:TetR/AcrR family transcriptional regulator n=1 Tax=Neobacillus citreus TaxID=2833578 RepID=A0A942T2L2_9BACI|nr:TetR/AcrR family transcriptional regulator [Neobacillus citreus]MCH6267285.1 TetR/AcrR family transcriptional regulator [Neobacillus citreus]
MKTKRKVDRRVARTRQMLKDALISLISEKEFAAISITDIINRSDLNRSTFYAHFCDKEELLACIINELIEGMMKSMQESPSITDPCQNGYARPTHATIQLFTYVAEHAHYYKTMLNNQRVPQLAQRLSDTLYKFYLKEIENHPDREDPLNLNKGFFACYLTSAVIGFIYHWVVITDLKYSPEFIAKELTKIFTMKPYIPYLQPSTSC